MPLAVHAVGPALRAPRSGSPVRARLAAFALLALLPLGLALLTFALLTFALLTHALLTLAGGGGVRL